MVIPLHLKLGFRYLQSQRTYSLLNVLGLALGLTIFLLSLILVSYERQYDRMFDNRERTLLLLSDFAPTSSEPIKHFPAIRTAYGPLLKQRLGEDYQVARALTQGQLLQSEQQAFIHGVKFVDAAFYDIFALTYLHGAPDPQNMAVSRNLAIKLFGTEAAVGQLVIVENRTPLTVSAVFEDLGPDTHFNADFRPYHELQALVPFSLLHALEGVPEAGQWTAPYAATYIEFPPGVQAADINPVIAEVYESHTPGDDRDYIGGISSIAVSEANQTVWRSLDLPLLGSITMMGLLVLLLATVNYTNLATALGQLRLREIGLRRTFGASRWQLVAQFFSEHLLLSLVAGLLALALCENLLPLYNDYTGKNARLAHFDVVVPLLLACFFVAACAAWFPIYLSSLAKVQSSLQKRLPGRAGSHVFSNALVVIQFSIAIFILALMLIIYFQNAKMRQLAAPFLSMQAQILTEVDRLPFENQIALREAVNELEQVSAASLSSDVPFNAWTRSREFQAGQGSQVSMDIVAVDPAFFDVNNLPLVAGSISAEPDGHIPIVINETAAISLGFTHAKNALGQVISRVQSTRYPQRWQFKVVGIAKNRYFGGVHRDIIPQGFYLAQSPRIQAKEDASTFKYLSVIFKPGQQEIGMQTLEQVWQRHAQTVPLIAHGTEYYLDLFFRIPKLIIKVLFGFALLSTVLAMTGLFGLSAFLARQRSHEMGVRKVMGASTWQIIRHLAWQFSMPVFVALILTFPLAYLAANVYLDFFPESINSAIPLIALAGAIALAFAWLVIALQAAKVALQSPVNAIRTRF